MRGGQERGTRLSPSRSITSPTGAGGRSRSRFLRVLVALATCAAALIVPISAPAPAQAAGSMTWYLDDVVFHTGATASGLFRFDADAGVYSDFEVVVTDPDGTVVRFAAVSPGAPANPTFVAAITDPTGDRTDRPVFPFTFDDPLTSAGGTIGIVPGPASYTGFCRNATCSVGVKGPYRDVISGTVTTTNAGPSFTSTATPTAAENQRSIIDVEAADDNDNEGAA